MDNSFNQELSTLAKPFRFCSFSYTYDIRGSVTRISDKKGVTTAEYTYSTYGNRVSTQDIDNFILGYCARDGVLTEANGLLYMRARYYSPDLMRFINEDIVTGDISNSNSLNRYSYVEGNPVTMVDPFGLEAMRARAQALEDKKVLDGVKFLGGLVLVRVPGLQGVGAGLLVSGATGLVVDILAQEKILTPKRWQ